VDHVPDPLLLRKCSSAGNRTQTSGSVTRNSDHLNREVVGITFLSQICITHVADVGIRKRESTDFNCTNTY
jgi:hypothetical protein